MPQLRKAVVLVGVGCLLPLHRPPESGIARGWLGGEGRVSTRNRPEMTLELAVSTCKSFNNK